MKLASAWEIKVNPISFGVYAEILHRTIWHYLFYTNNLQYFWILFYTMNSFWLFRGAANAWCWLVQIPRIRRIRRNRVHWLVEQFGQQTISSNPTSETGFVHYAMHMLQNIWAIKYVHQPINNLIDTKFKAEFEKKFYQPYWN